MIRYVILLLREIVTKWSVTNTNESERITFRTYDKFRTIFLKRFTNLNSLKTIVKRLLNLRQEKIKIQEFVIKMIMLTHRVILENQVIKILIFRELYSKDQNRIMLINSIKTENELNVEIIDQYLYRITTLIKRNKIRREK